MHSVLTVSATIHAETKKNQSSFDMQVDLSYASEENLQDIIDDILELASIIDDYYQYDDFSCEHDIACLDGCIESCIEYA